MTKNIKIIQIILLIIIVIGVGLLATQKYWVDPLVNFILKQEEINSKKDPLNLTFTISGNIYTLINGKFEREIVDSTGSSSASKEVVQVFGQPVYGDLNGDGVEDAVMYITQNSGGSGTFFYVVEAINFDGIFKGTNAMLLGDRIAPQNINIIDGRAVVNFAERKAGESFAVQPSLGRSIYVHFDKNTGEIGEWVKDFEGESSAVQCLPEQRNADVCIEIYAPVCATVEIQCIKAPCNPIQETFPNSCNACKNSLVKSYVPGECAGTPKINQ